MARPLRVSAGGFVYHVINRRAGKRRIFRSQGDYIAFEKALTQAAARFPGVMILAYCLMPNHWHLVLWPKKDGELSRFMQWLTVTHMRRWHAHRGSAGNGPLYQGRFKSFVIQQDEHLLIVIRYVERNALRAKLVERAEGWLWSSIARRTRGSAPSWLVPLSHWPVEPPDNWTRQVNHPQTDAELAALNQSIKRGAPFGDAKWQKQTVIRLNLQSTLRNPGDPQRRKDKMTKIRVPDPLFSCAER